MAHHYYFFPDKVSLADCAAPETVSDTDPTKPLEVSEALSDLSRTVSPICWVELFWVLYSVSTPP